MFRDNKEEQFDRGWIRFEGFRGFSSFTRQVDWRNKREIWYFILRRVDFVLGGEKINKVYYLDSESRL